MNKVFAFLSGAASGALLGAAIALLFTPASGSELIREAQERWELTKSEARRAMEEKRQEMENQFDAAKQA
jgi:gas vesicle protein